MGFGGARFPPLGRPLGIGRSKYLDQAIDRRKAQKAETNERYRPKRAIAAGRLSREPCLTLRRVGVPTS
jgi:hypothetical protein